MILPYFLAGAGFLNSITGMLILVFTLFQFHLLLIYIFRKKNPPLTSELLKNKVDSYIPFVTIQIPIFNERYVVERIIDAVCNLNYPSDKLQIQILDDSTDETSMIIKKKTEHYCSRSIDINHVQRQSREGFKAGALSNGLLHSKGELIVIFDADFIPSANFLKETIPYFVNEELGFLQTRWQHCNRGYSLLTRLQAFGLDAHYTIQQTGRYTTDYFSNFTGTAGIWRKKCIIAAGNWSDDTLTEDLDLSYAAQLKGWKYVYLEQVATPAELPPTIGSLKSQQYRWTKGAVECARKHLWAMLISQSSVIKKLHSLFHLLYVFIFLFAFSSSLLSIPLMFMKQESLDSGIDSLYSFCCFINTVFFWVSYRRTSTKSLWKGIIEFIYTLPLFTSVLTGLLLNNTFAVIEGLIRKKTSFIRTPKFNSTNSVLHLSLSQYYTSGFSLTTLLEGILFLAFTFAFVAGIVTGRYSFLILHGMSAMGYGTVFYFTIAPIVKSLFIYNKKTFHFNPKNYETI